MTAFNPISDRRAAGGDALAAVLLDAPGGATFEDLLAAAPQADARDVAGWVGHAVAEGLITDVEGGRFRLRARGRRLFSARRRARELSGGDSVPSAPPS